MILNYWTPHFILCCTIQFMNKRHGVDTLAILTSLYSVFVVSLQLGGVRVWYINFQMYWSRPLVELKLSWFPCRLHNEYKFYPHLRIKQHFLLARGASMILDRAGDFIVYITIFIVLRLLRLCVRFIAYVNLGVCLRKHYER